MPSWVSSSGTYHRPWRRREDADHAWLAEIAQIGTGRLKAGTKGIGQQVRNAADPVSPSGGGVLRSSGGSVYFETKLKKGTCMVGPNKKGPPVIRQDHYWHTVHEKTRADDAALVIAWRNIGACGGRDDTH